MEETFPERLAARAPSEPLMLARIDEERCIGCVLCLDACPFDAIAGAPKRMHIVLEALCTGCELCIPPCPVDCIAMVPSGRTWGVEDAAAARRRFDARRPRVSARDRQGAAPDPALPAFAGADAEREFRRRAAAAATERARARRLARPDKARSGR